MPEDESNVPNSGRPDISVIIPAFNASATIELQLEALVDQAHDIACEILVCDNGSTDSTRTVVERWSVSHPAIRVVDASARRGPAAARNIGVGQARAPKLAFCDADDKVGAGWLPLITASLDDHEFVAGSYEFALLNEGIEVPGLWTGQRGRLTSKAYLPALPVAGSGNMGVRTSIFRSVGGFFEGLRTAEDDDFCLRVQLTGHPLVYVPDLVLHVRRRAGLRNISRQAFAYAAGERRLSFRYSEYTRDFAGRTSASATATTPPPPASSVRRTSPIDRVVAGVSRAARKLVTMRRANDLAAITWRWSWRLGWLLTHEDPRIPRVRPDDASTLVVPGSDSSRATETDRPRS